MSDSAMTSPGVRASLAPAFKNSSFFSAVRFQTVTLCPELSRFLTIPDPMIPSPRKPNLRVEAWMSLSLRICEEVEMSMVGEAGRSRVGRSRKLETVEVPDFFLFWELNSPLSSAASLSKAAVPFDFFLADLGFLVALDSLSVDEVLFLAFLAVEGVFPPLSRASNSASASSGSPVSAPALESLRSLGAGMLGSSG